MIVALRYNVAPTESPGTLPFVIPLLLWNNKGSVPPARDQQLFLLGASLCLSPSPSLSVSLICLCLSPSLCCFCLSCSLSLTFCSCGFLVLTVSPFSLSFSFSLFLSPSVYPSLPMSLPSLSVALVLWVSLCLSLSLSPAIPLDRRAVIKSKACRHLAAHPDTEHKATGPHPLHTPPLRSIQRGQVEARTWAGRLHEALTETQWQS